MISIVIPAYNNIELFKTAILSVLKQKDAVFEIIVSDDSKSTDIEDYCLQLRDPRIRYYRNIPSKGAIDNWNYGLSLAKGEYLILLHHDESFINPDYLSRIGQLLEKYDVAIHSKTVMCTSGVKTDKIPEWVKKIAINLKYPLFSLNVIGPCACVAIKRSVYKEFDNRLHWKVDTEWYFRILRKARNVYYSSSLEILSHHGHEGQITNTIDIKETNKKDIVCIKQKYGSPFVSMFVVLGQLLQKFK